MLMLRVYPDRVKAKEKVTCRLEGLYGFKPGNPDQEAKVKVIFTPMDLEVIKEAMSLSFSLVCA